MAGQQRNVTDDDAVIQCLMQDINVGGIVDLKNTLGQLQDARPELLIFNRSSLERWWHRLRQSYDASHRSNQTPLYPIVEYAFLYHGQSMIGKSRSSDVARSQEAFQRVFGTTPLICKILWGMIQPIDYVSEFARARHLLWALLFLKHNTTEAINSIIAKADRSSFRDWHWDFVIAIAGLYLDVIRWEKRLENQQPGDYIFTGVDGTDFRVRKRKTYHKSWYSFKFKGPALRYEVAISLRNGDIVWTNGPFLPGNYVDITIFRADMIHYLRPGEKVLADKGYRGQRDRVVVSEGDEVEYDFLRARHEMVNGRFKQWTSLDMPWRHGMQKHQLAFRAIVVITQLELEHVLPIFNVDF